MTNLTKFKAEAIIFDKDGTLIDFDLMGGNWIVYPAGRIQQASGLAVHEPLFQALGYDAQTRQTLAHGKLAAASMPPLYAAAGEVLQILGLSPAAAAALLEDQGCIPDPVELAKPFTDLRYLFSKLHHAGLKRAITTADDRIPTQSLVEAFDIALQNSSSPWFAPMTTSRPSRSRMPCR